MARHVLTHSISACVHADGVESMCQRTSSLLLSCNCSESSTVAVQVSTGWKHSAAVGHAGELYAWGWGGSVGTATSFETGRSSGGQLGLGNEFDYWAPTNVAELQVDGGTPPQQQQAIVDWRTLQVSCGFNHTAAIVGVQDC